VHGKEAHVAGKLERYIHLLLRERLGAPPPDLSARIMQRIDGGAQAKPLPAAPTFRPWMAIAASIAVMAAIALGISAWLVNREAPVVPTARGGNEVRIIPSEQQKANEQVHPQPDPPTQKPEPKLPEEIEKPQPKPQPEPKPPTPEQPKPEGPIVDKPKPQPQPEPEPEPTPTPEEPKPEGPIVDKPEPKPEPQPERPPTEAEPPKPVKIGSVLFAPDKARLEWRADADGKWQDLTVGADVMSGMQLRTRKPVAIELPDGARFYFDGDIALAGDDKAIDVSIDDNSVYFDVYGSKRSFTVRRNESVLTFKDAEVVAERSGAKLAITCLGGEISHGDVKLAAGFTATLDDDGFSRPKAADRARRQALVEEVDSAFVLMREDFSTDLKGKVYCGEVMDGAVSGGGGKDSAVGFELPNELVVRERGYLRLRVRINGSRDGLSLGFGSGKGSDWAYFQTHLERVENDNWVVLRIPLSKFIDEGRKKAAWPGVVFHKFQIVLWTKEGSSADLDWIEYGVDPEWNVKEKK
jgi:hypothetical protein